MKTHLPHYLKKYRHFLLAAGPPCQFKVVLLLILSRIGILRELVLRAQFEMERFENELVNSSPTRSNFACARTFLLVCVYQVDWTLRRYLARRNCWQLKAEPRLTHSQR